MFLLNWIILMVILQTMGWFLENPNHGYFYNQHSHRHLLEIPIIKLKLQ